MEIGGDDIAVKVLAALLSDAVGQPGCRDSRAEQQGSGLHAQLIPEPGLQKSVERDGTSLHDEALPAFFPQVAEGVADAGGPKETVGNTGVAVAQHDALGSRTAPVAHVELRSIRGERVAADENGVVLCAQVVGEHEGEGGGEAHPLLAVADVAVGTLSPLEQNVGAPEGVEGDETAVELLTFLAKHTHRHPNAGVEQLADAASAHFGEGIDAAHHDTGHALPDDEVGAGRGASIVRAGFQTHVEGGRGEQWLVGRPHRGKTVDFGMTFATAHVVALADDSLSTHEHGADHRIGLGIAAPSARQLKAAAHEALVGRRHRGVAAT